MSIGTASRPKSPTLVTKAAGASAAPEKYSLQNQRTINTPGVKNKTAVATKRRAGTVANTLLNGPKTAHAATTASTRLVSNHRRWMRPLFTLSSILVTYERVRPVEAAGFTGSTVSEVPSTLPALSLASTAR